MIVEPGKQYDVRINLSSEGEKITINGNTSKIDKLYNTFPNHEHPQFDELWSLFDSSATVIRETLLERKNQELSQINELYQKGDIPIEVFNLLSQDRILYNMNVMGFIASINVLQQLRQGHEMIDNEFMRLWHEANSSVSLSDKYFFSTIQAFQFLGNIIWYNLYSSVAFTDAVETQTDFVNKGLRHTRNIELSRKYLDPDVSEYYQAAYIFFNSYQKKYEKELISIMQQFKEDFPNSKYLSFISPFIDNIVAFHEKAEIELSENILILENYSEISSFEQAMAKFKGKRIYIDIWATWCGPCKAEFAHNEELKEMLNSEGVEMFYISTDRDNDDEQWKNMIKFYNLEGYHIRANEILKAELRELLNMKGIPHFVLVDENGQVIIQDAKRPSQLAELEKQIREN